MRNRIKVLENQYQLGDIIEGKRIVDFGRAWEEPKHSEGWCKNGQRWEEECCYCNKYGTVDNDCDLCEKCYGKLNGNEKQRAQYAYLEEV